MIFINPGSGEIENANFEHAYKNILVFIQDLELGEGNVKHQYIESESEKGRFMFHLTCGKNTCEIEMPGLPLEEVRYLGQPNQNIWHFPRLYVDGSSWVWEFAIDSAMNRLIGDDD